MSTFYVEWNDSQYAYTVEKGKDQYLLKGPVGIITTEIPLTNKSPKKEIAQFILTLLYGRSVKEVSVDGEIFKLSSFPQKKIKDISLSVSNNKVTREEAEAAVPSAQSKKEEVETAPTTKEVVPAEQLSFI